MSEESSHCRRLELSSSHQRGGVRSGSNICDFDNDGRAILAGGRLHVRPAVLVSRCVLIADGLRLIMEHNYWRLPRGRLLRIHGAQKQQQQSAADRSQKECSRKHFTVGRGVDGHTIVSRNASARH